MSSAAQRLRKAADAAHKRGSKELADDLHAAARRESLYAQDHKWGPWISDPAAFGGRGNRICSCGAFQWADQPDPHAVSRDNVLGYKRAESAEHP